MKKTYFLILINILLIAAIIIALTFSNKNHLSTKNTDFFLNKIDVNSIQKLDIGRVELAKKENGWFLSKKTQASPLKVNSLLKVIEKLELKRELKGSPKRNLLDQIDTKGTDIRVFSDNQSLYFKIFGDSLYTYVRSVKEDNIYLVHIPGYYFSISELFKDNYEYWIDRRLLKTNWYTLQNLKISYPKKLDFEVFFDSSFLKIKGMAQYDTARLYNYILSLNSFEATSVDSTKTKKTDLKAAVKIDLQDLNKSNNASIQFFDVDTAYLAIPESKKWNALVTKEALNNILVNNLLLRQQNF